jgi:NADPH:quinone reductase-like Zn-dependent oxidoreductase
MRAIRFDHYGEPADVLTVTEQPVPQPGAGQVRLKIRFSPINPSDLLFVRGHYSGVTPHFPSGAGFEGAAVIDAVGPEVEGLAVGQRVFSRNSQGGNWSQYAVVPAERAWPVPDNIPDEQIASLLINPATAILMVRHVLAVPRGDWLLQSAANSELGRMIIKLAKHDGIKTINVVRRHEAVQELKELGADEVIVSADAPIDEQVRKTVGPQGVDFAIDPVAGQTGTEIFRSLSEDGRMLLYGSLTGEGISVGDDPRLTLSGRRTLEVYWLGYWLPRLDKSGFFAPDRPAIPQLIDEIVDLIRQGILETSPGKKFGLDDIRAAVTEAESVGHSGKVFLAPNGAGH